MTFSVLLLHLAGAAMLLIWAVRMVRTGVERGHAGLLRRIVRRAERGRFASTVAGAVSAILLQGSTAVCLLAASFVEARTLSVAAALAIVLGADLGSALVVFLLSFDLSWLMPILMIIGGGLFLRGQSRPVKQAGRILLGLALVLLSLKLIREATDPVSDSQMLTSIIAYLNNDPVSALLLGAAVTWVMHSSVAAILLFVALASQGLIPLWAGVGLVLGGNIGSGAIAVGLSRHLSPEGRRVAWGNLLVRTLAAALAVAVLWSWRIPLPAGIDVATALIGVHLAFNMVLVLTVVPLNRLLADGLAKLIPSAPVHNGDASRSGGQSVLDEAVVNEPVPALASATRELLRMGSMLEVMMRPVMTLYDASAGESIERIQEIEKDIDASQTRIKLYLAEVSRNQLSESESSRVLALASFAINLEHAGDVVTQTLMRLAKKKRDNDWSFSSEGWRELTRLHDRVMANMQLSMNVLVSEDVELARQLVQEKSRISELERQGSERHLMRLQSGHQHSIDTSNIHLETLRALRQINSAFASVAYPILSDTGGLLDNRLAEI